MKQTIRMLAVLLVWVMFGTVPVVADTFTQPLNFVQTSGASGQYLSADFDFHTVFSRIDSVTLTFSMPVGYANVAAAGGYFSVFSQLWMAVHSTDTAPIFDYDLAGPVYTFTDLRTTTAQVPAGTPQLFGLYPPLVIVTDPPTYYGWPDFLSSGRGNVAMADVVDSSIGFPPIGPVTTTTSWQLPGDVVDGSITIVGVPVPEPKSFWLFGAGLAAIGVIWRLRQGIRFSGCQTS